MNDRNSDNPTAHEHKQWLEFARIFLGHDDKDALSSARDAATDTQIRRVLTEVMEEDSAKLNPEAAYSLAKQLDSQGYRVEATVLRLLVLSTVAELTDKPETLPEEEKVKLLETSFATCQHCIDIALDAGLPEVAARYMFILGNGLVKLRKWALARSTCEEVLHIYQALAEKEPHTYKPYVAMTLALLGDVMCEQRAFSYAQLAYEEAMDIYAELAEKYPDTYGQRVIAMSNNLETLPH